MFRLIVVLAALGVATVSSAQTNPCNVRDWKKYYGHDLDKKYEARKEASAITDGIYRGALMREGDPAGLGTLRTLFLKERQMDVRRVQDIAKGVLYGDSEEFRELVKKLTAKEGEVEARARARDSMYRAFGYRPRGGASEEALDACLIGGRQAHVVLAKVIVDFMDRKKLD